MPEYWCSDFANWVWAQAGANVSNITPESGSFAHDGVHSTPHVGDAVLFNLRPGTYNADHVAIVVKVNSDGSIVSIGRDENGINGSYEDWASNSKVAQDGPYAGAVGSPGLAGPISGYVSPPSGGSVPSPGGSKPANSQWVRTFTTAHGYATTNGTTSVGSLYGGTNYVYCREWGAEVGDSTAYNHYWMWTDLDTGGHGWVSAYYIQGQGNDQADDTSGNALRTCPAGTGGTSSGGSAEYWVSTYASATGYADTSENDRVGTLNAGSNYVFCKEWGAEVGSGSAYNHYWLWTDLDTGGQGWVSAYYLQGEGDDQATDTSGDVIPNCAGSTGGGSSVGSSKYYVDTFAPATGYSDQNESSAVGTLNAGTNYVLCKKWGTYVGSGDSYNHWWLLTDLDTGGRGYVSAYYLSRWGNDEARDNSGNIIPTC